MSTPGSNAASLHQRVPWDTAYVVLALGLLITAIIYLDTLSFQFVYDDLTLIVRNPQVQSWRYVPYFFKEHLWASVAGQGNYYRPVFQLWLLLNHTLFGLDPMGWHLSTVAVHLGVTLLVYPLVVLLGGDRLTAAVAATLFGVHPVHIESVAWVAGVCDSLLSLFFLGALVAYLRARKSPTAMRWRALALVLYGLALLTKEVAGMLPALVLGYEWIYASESETAHSQRLRKALVAIIPFAAVTAVYLAVRWLVLPPFQQPQGIGVVRQTRPTWSSPTPGPCRPSRPSPGSLGSGISRGCTRRCSGAGSCASRRWQSSPPRPNATRNPSAPSTRSPM